MRRDEHSFCTFATIRLAQSDHMLLNADLALAVPLPQTDSMYTRQSSTVVVLVAQPGRRRLMPVLATCLVAGSAGKSLVAPRLHMMCPAP